MRKINILQLMTDSKVGGAEKIVLEIAKRLDKEKFNVLVCCLSAEGPIFNEAKKENVRILALGLQNKLYFFRALKLIKLLRDEKIDILQTHLFHANLLGRVLGRWAGVKIIISTEHIMGLESALRIRLNRWSSFLADRFIAISYGVGEFLNQKVGIPLSKITIIQNGIALNGSPGAVSSGAPASRAGFGLRQEDKVVGIVARLCRQKGHIFLLRAFKKVRESIPQAKLLIVGCGPLKKEIQEAVRDLGIGDNVILAGFRDDVAAIMPVIDLFVLSSLWEGLPVTILEAMAAKKPVVATRVGGVAEAVEDGVSGILVEPFDPEALANAMIKLLRDEQLSRRMGQAGWDKLNEHFDARRMVKETERLYEVLINSRKILIQ